MMQWSSNAYRWIGEIVSLGLDDLQLVLGLIYIIQSNDMRVFDKLHDGYLTFDPSVYSCLVNQ
jgi:hypothetical protein